MRVFVWLAISVVLVVSYQQGYHATQASASVRCQEDESCWRWSTMGNRQRGVLIKGSDRVVVVGPCAYKRLRDARRLSASNPRLRGDAWAARHGCRRES